ncbi:Major facilitator superfamily domain-containing protein 10 [Pseudolycoriella hygida]|uniref:Major facilitator superfamily domain-containing protein 10 n=1 Tax=Pseudolycoriella hygida TaxID=35572 RepID=A0A9Q0S1G3_9DIPT|nr:Major facilitator superfamily domain-containing protein 10 [Pseudolycoriella hygida]
MYFNNFTPLCFHTISIAMASTNGVTQRKPSDKENGNSRKSTSNTDSKDQSKTHPTVYIVFISLLLDLLAFTMILPLLPSLLEYYRLNDKAGLYHSLSHSVKFFQELVGAPDKYNSVLFGGFLGSMFSFLQFIVSPIVGGLSDCYGRKPVMLVCLNSMFSHSTFATFRARFGHFRRTKIKIGHYAHQALGIAASYGIWALSSNFAIFVLARFVGGLSKGNISLSMAVITDVSNEKNRGKGMALVGIAFSLGFIIGPMIGAIFSKYSDKTMEAWFWLPAIFAMTLATADLLFVAGCLKETLLKEKRAKHVVNSLSRAMEHVSVHSLFKFEAVKNLPKDKLQSLQSLGLIYFVYLFIYSGLEFTVTFLMYHKFGFTSIDQAKMFLTTGIVMALLQGSVVRRLPNRRTQNSAVFGLYLIVPAFILVGLASDGKLLYAGMILFAILDSTDEYFILATAFVVTCMTTLVSEYGRSDQKGTVLGIYRSLGALARALGPIAASIAFWSVGSTITYILGGLLLLWPALMLQRLKLVQL